MISREEFDNLIIKKRKHRKFTDSVPLEFKGGKVIETEKAPWHNVRLIHDTGRLEKLDELIRHRDELFNHYKRLQNEKDAFMDAFRSGKLSPGQGKYALEYEEKLDEIGYNQYRRDAQVWAADMYSKSALLSVYNLLRARHPKREEFPPQSSYRDRRTTKAMLAQILTDGMELNVDEIGETLEEARNRLGTPPRNVQQPPPEFEWLPPQIYNVLP